MTMHEKLSPPNLQQFLKQLGPDFANTNPLVPVPHALKPKKDASPVYTLHYPDRIHQILHSSPDPAINSGLNYPETPEDLIQVYTGPLGYDFRLCLAVEQSYLHALATGLHETINKELDCYVLDLLARTDAFESTLSQLYGPKKRFGLEGLDTLNLALDFALKLAAKFYGVQDVAVGMAHRGRLNAMANVLGSNPAEIYNLYRSSILREAQVNGDVAYHEGFLKTLSTGAGDLRVFLAPNPSHLEHVTPVVNGYARAHKGALPIVVHGDAAFIGQGITAETLNLSQLTGYNVDGTIHIIANNQLGFTATSKEVTSAATVADLAKGFRIPIIHVNADDPFAVMKAVRMAMTYRHQFKKDFVINLIGYRRNGHNEGDNPSMTSPKLYKKISQHQTALQLFTASALERGNLTPEEIDQISDQTNAQMRQAHDTETPYLPLYPSLPMPENHSSDQLTITQSEIHALARHLHHLTTRPDGGLNNTVQRALNQRLQMLEGKINLDFATAEQLALTAIMRKLGIPVRLTGEDVTRGTFSHRHAVAYTPSDPHSTYPVDLAHLLQFHNSPVTELATVAFEYGHTISGHPAFTMWEAQFGDFLNGAQVILEEFLYRGLERWGLSSHLVLSLPHGAEGQGTDHTAAPLERLLQLAVGPNVRILQPTRAAQYAHALLKHAANLHQSPGALILLMPKSGLRRSDFTSPLKELTSGEFSPVIFTPPQGPVEKIVLTSGKHGLDLVAQNLPHTAIIRLEQLYPWPESELKAILDSYPQVSLFITQEEPENQGHLAYTRDRLCRMGYHAQAFAPAASALKAPFPSKPTDIITAITAQLQNS